MSVDPMTMSTIMQSPLVQWLAQNTGLMAVGNLMSSESPYQQATNQMTGIGSQLIPQLQQQSDGAPTPATRAQNQQLNQSVNRMQQSYAAGATRSGMAGPVGRGGQQPATVAQQGRYQASKMQGMAQIMGQSQQSAQGMLAGLYQTGYTSQGLLEAEQRQARGETFSNLSQSLADHQLAKQQGIVDAEEQETFDMLREMLLAYKSELLKGGEK